MFSNSPEEKGKKRHRRTAQEIERKFRCECGKGYGSEGALRMHIKIKHSEETPTLEKQEEVEEEFMLASSSSTSTPSPSFSSNSSSDSFSIEGTPEFVMTSEESFSDDMDFEFKELREAFSHIPIMQLNIGLWQAESQCCGDLAMKFCYRDRSIIWEIFDVGSLLRCVILFDDLNGVGLELHSDDTATMVIELRCAPVFYRGVLQPHEATIWTPIGDFTEGMASTFRRHILHFSRRALNEPIEGIFCRDSHLQGLLLQGLPALKSPYFVPETVPPLYYISTF
jgi:hypothetical protein